MMTLHQQATNYAKAVEALYNRRKIKGLPVSLSQGARHLSVSVRLGDSLDLDKAVKLSDNLALYSGSERVMSTRQAGLVIYQFELAQRYWQSYTRADLPDMRALGLGEKRAPVLFRLDPPHVLVTGTTGAGKSKTITSATVSLAQTHPASLTPGGLNLVLIDPHSEFEMLDNLAHLAMPRVTDAAGIANAFRFVESQLRWRKQEKMRAEKVHKLVVVVDEIAAEEVLADDRNLAICEAIASEGRKFGIHVIVGTQKPSQKRLPDILDKLNNKWVGRVDDARMSAMVTGQAGLEAHKLTGRGDFLHVDGPNVQRLQVAMATKNDFEKLPRTEVKPVEVEPAEFLEPDETFDFEDDDRAVGRPAVELDPLKLAIYLLHGFIGRTKAAQLGIGRTSHEVHSEFYRQTMVEFAKLILKEFDR